LGWGHDNFLMMAKAKKSKSGLSPWLLTALPYLVFIFIGFATADLLILSYRDKMLPDQAPPAPPKKQASTENQSRSFYASITQRNIFSSEGLIPPPLTATGEDGKPQEEAPPVPSSLPLALMGTIVHSNPAKSIANIEVKSKNQVLPFVVGRDIEGIASLVSVERGKAIIRNTNNGRLEFIEMKIQGQKLAFQSARSSGGAGGEVAQVAPNKFEIKRSDLNRYLSDMQNVLQQASMSPRRNASGEIECFRFNAIQAGSIYTQLGMQTGDCISKVNGIKIESPQQAMQMYSELRTASQINITFERDGRDQESSYFVK
jgi:general secretion pathway protein C